MTDPLNSVLITQGLRAARALLPVLLVIIIPTLGFYPAKVIAPDVQPTAHSASNDAEENIHGRVAVGVDQQWLTRLAIKTEPVQFGEISRSMRAVATVVPDEERISHIHTRVAGWIEQLHIATTGQAVEQGQPLVSIFSQDLYAAQTEYIAALPGAGQSTQPSSRLQKSARLRLEVLGMSDAEITQITKSREPLAQVILHAPRSGVVLRRSVSVGTAVDPSTELMTIADLSQVWVIAELPERDIPLATLGASVQVAIPAAELPPFTATIDFIYPTLSELTRSLRVRISVPNPGRRLLPGMSGSVSFQGSPRQVLSVPRDAVVDTGEMQHVFIQPSPGHFEPRRVRVGARLTERIEILEGLSEGEEVVTSGVFLLDSESRLRGSGGAGHAGHGQSATQSQPSQQPAQQPSIQPSPSAADDDPHRGHR